MYSKVILCKQQPRNSDNNNSSLVQFYLWYCQKWFHEFFPLLLNNTDLVRKCQSAHFSRSDTRLCVLDWIVTHSITVKRHFSQFSLIVIQNFVKSCVPFLKNFGRNLLNYLIKTSFFHFRQLKNNSWRKTELFCLVAVCWWLTFGSI